ncbi:PREDICTED: riboflavin kinase [Dinoponera quadriceps]|uniref:riboflavin kinase n=1 Tax=Dinoponera quadriceps TaxID=609295 RepID=A0A6P3X8F9_DINQU|nr:PREDICTED: riboflavin kinase [Dinoponera quadriceps]XP_014474603.1 PREDICTED: riboflavin kinase [Dinoponera quadriceps]
MGSQILPHFTSGVIVKGFGRGSKVLGIPTANFPESVVEDLPKDLVTGIYYGWASLHRQIYKMVASIGWNPYYKNEKKSLEVHLLHKSQGDLYGEELKMIIVGYIRPEKDFSSVEELIQEIRNDITIAEERLEEACLNKLKKHDFLIK